MAATRKSQRSRKPVHCLVDEMISLVEYEGQSGIPQIPKKDTYYVEIKEVDAKNNRVKVHFIGYLDKYDE